MTDGVAKEISEKEFLSRVNAGGFLHAPESADVIGRASHTIPPLMLPRSRYAAIFGPTTGDRIRLGDTNLYVEVEKDYTVYGEEIKFGGGKVIREVVRLHTHAPNNSNYRYEKLHACI